MSRQEQEVLFGLNDKPPIPTAAFVGFQHLLAVFGGIVTAPLLIAQGMALSPQETSYLMSSALVISGLSTPVQINRIGPVGCGMLSIQGTSFSFVVPLIYVYGKQTGLGTPEEILGLVFGACAACSILMMILSQFVNNLSIARRYQYYSISGVQRRVHRDALEAFTPSGETEE